ncbi:increased loss of mitochondrial DNA protein 1 [Lineolata rhizophorae]|uniref:Increased loss of mitochondrial DNA protein 1 n=1 Tax=Lineolata rhizophorae TaxID=578093 RepID=A0A6A6NYN6_9PEZI|nr:increased loss of mitochondrial DNA protein 1 [Lineolata rhizophorae]
MAIVSPFTIIRGLSVFHLTLGFFFLTSPDAITNQNIVFLLGEAMKLPHIRFDSPSPATAFIAVALGLLGVSDLTAASMADEVALPYWMSQCPIRLLFLFAVTGYTYVFKKGGLFAAAGNTNVASGPGENLKNSMVFTWGFLELAAWFWVFLSLRDERRQAAVRILERRKADSGSMR